MCILKLGEIRELSRSGLYQNPMDSARPSVLLDRYVAKLHNPHKTENARRKLSISARFVLNNPMGLSEYISIHVAL